MEERPIGVTILAILAGLLCLINIIITLRFLGFFPFIGPVDVRIFNLWYALLYGLLAYIWFWVAKMLWEVDPQGWMFLLFVSILSLSFDFVVLITGGSWYDVNASIILSALILIYVMLPGTREAFGTD
ncbi:hypothetical protein V7O62_12525 [Methanolobus sp. ZRKC2]|uniref:hypothetical protein n=1 Tax=Methanolobus sp. ZRKC2 TaxID=3125783 RepID=UPI003252B781